MWIRRKCCAEFVLRERLALYCYLAGTVSSAGTFKYIIVTYDFYGLIYYAK